MIASIVNWMTEIMESLGYLGVTIAVFLETIFPPIPSAFIQPFSGFVASQSNQSLIIVILSASIGSYLGTVPFYFLGVWGEEVIYNFLYKYGKYLFIEKDEVDKAFDFFDKHGSSIVLTGRLVPLVRTVISFPAGVAKMPFIKFTIYTLLGTTIWSAILASAGYLLGERWEILLVWIEQYETLSIILIILVITGYIGYKIISRKRNKSKKPHDL